MLFLVINGPLLSYCFLHYWTLTLIFNGWILVNHAQSRGDKKGIITHVMEKSTPLLIQRETVFSLGAHGAHWGSGSGFTPEICWSPALGLDNSSGLGSFYFFPENNRLIASWKGQLKEGSWTNERMNEISSTCRLMRLSPVVSAVRTAN